jgi:hypothetical protein
MTDNEKTSYVTVTPGRVTLKAIPMSKIGAIILWFLIIVGILVPVLVTALAIKDGDQIKPTILVSYAIFWGVSIYFYRLYSWNTSGQEIISKEDNKFRIVSKSNHVKFAEHTIDSESCYFLAIPTRQRKLNGKEVQMGRLFVRNSQQEIELSIELQKDDLGKILNALNKKETMLNSA